MSRDFSRYRKPSTRKSRGSKRPVQTSQTFRNRLWQQSPKNARLARWAVRAALLAIIAFSCAAAAMLFREIIFLVGKLRLGFWPLMLLLPLAGPAVTALYRRFDFRDDEVGVGTALAAARTGRPMRVVQAPLIFFASALTHAVGGSAGREGAALEMGGALASACAGRFSLSDEERKIAVLAGMAASFAALFGTPWAAAHFVLEIADRRLIFRRFLPVAAAALVAEALTFGCGFVTLHVGIPFPFLTFSTAGRIVLLALILGLGSRLFLFSALDLPALIRRRIPDSFWRGAICGSAILACAAALGTRYNGLGQSEILAALGGQAKYSDFFWKSLLTSLTIAAGMKGGEIIPAFFVGSTLGAAACAALGLTPAFGAGLGMVALFGAVAHAPTAAVLLGVELFGLEGTLPFAVATAVCLIVSGRRSLYNR